MDSDAIKAVLGGAGGAGADAVRDTLNATLGVCKCVLVDAAGAASEVALDMSPQTRAVQTTLGGSVTFLGQWEPLGVFLVTRRDDAGPELPAFAGKLPEPFGAAEFRGAVLLTRTDDDGNPADFPLAEYEAFAAKAPEAWQARPTAEDFAAVADDTDDKAELEAMLLEAATTKYREEHGRAPTEEELAKLVPALKAAIEAGDESEEVEKMVLAQVLGKFEADHGRAPTAEEKAEILEEIQDTMAGFEGDESESGSGSDEEDEDEEDDDDDDAEEAALYQVRLQVLTQCLAKFESDHGRPPTAAERKDLEATIDAKLSGGDEVAGGEAVLLEKIVQHFTAQHGRAPSAEEVETILGQLAAAEGGEEDEEEEEEAAAAPAPAEEPEEAAGAVDEEGILAELVELFEKNNGRAPTEAEVQQWKDTLAEAAADAAAEAAPPKAPSPPAKPSKIAATDGTPAASKKRGLEAEATTEDKRTAAPKKGPEAEPAAKRARCEAA